MKYVFADESWEDICIGRNGQKNAKALKSAHKGYREKPLWRYRQTRSVKHNYRGFWSRRKDKEHRLIYQVREDELRMVKCRFHYD